MGMFDTFHFPYQGGQESIQCKDFECSLENFYLGDVVDASQVGLGFFVEDFFASSNSTQSDFKKHEYDGNRFIVGILDNGVWIDYCIVPTKYDADQIIIDCKKHYMSSSLPGFSYKLIAHSKNLLLDDLYLKINSLSNLKFHISQKNKPGPFGLLRLSTNNLTKKSLTKKNYLIQVDQFIDSTLKNNLKNIDYFRVFEIEKPYYFYDDPSHLPSNDLNVTEESVLQSIYALDILRLKLLINTDLKFNEKLSPKFFVRLETFLNQIRKTYFGSIAWLSIRLCFSHIPLSDNELKVIYSDKTRASLWLYFSECLGVSDDFLNNTLTNFPNIVENFGTDFPLFSLHTAYTKTTSTIESMSLNVSTCINHVSEDGLSPIHKFLSNIGHYDHSIKMEILRKVYFCVKNGADVHFLDPKGNTPLMQIFIQNNISSANLFRDKEFSSEILPLIKILLRNHPLSHTNKDGQTLASIWPAFISNEILAEEENMQLTAAKKSTPGNVTALHSL